MAELLLNSLPHRARLLLPTGTATLAALHDIGKITLGFQVKCAAWPIPPEFDERTKKGAHHSVSDHALVSQVFLQQLLKPSGAQLWAAAVGAHHGRPKGTTARRPEFEGAAEWAEAHRQAAADQLIRIFGALPAQPPDTGFGLAHSDLWLLAGLITVADWIGSNEKFFSAETPVPPAESRRLSEHALRSIGWPGGALRQTGFAEAFAPNDASDFQPNSVQATVSTAAPGLVIVEAPMGCGKTEAALRVAQQWIVAGHHHGLYFALPTQVTSNRIHQRVGRFLANVLGDPANFRLAHGHAWLREAFDLQLRPAHASVDDKDQDDPTADVHEARSWFASSKQALLAPYGVGTIDQALQGVVTVKHFFVRRFALAGKVVILDEIHTYDVYTGALVGALVRELLNLGCSVVILSATLTTLRRRELLAAAGCTEGGNPTAYPLVTCAVRGGAVTHTAPGWNATKRVWVCADNHAEHTVLDELIRRAETGQHVLWIRNTVIEAQQCFRTLRGAIREGPVKLGLLHSRFPFGRREELERDWLERLGPARPTDGPGSILVATQVVEQSVDIDLDFIVSDLAPTDMLLQRVGRLWRHDRPTRAAAKPEFWIRLPQIEVGSDATHLKRNLGRSARVYAPYVLLRSAAVWRDVGELNLPMDIRPLLEATYAAPADSEPAAWTQLRQTLEYEKRDLTLRAEAAMRVFGQPMLNPDDDQALTRRKGAPTVPLLLLHSTAQLPGRRWMLIAPDAPHTTHTVSDYEWSIHSARFLHCRLVKVPRWQVPADAPRPNWLRLHVAANAAVACIGEDGRLRFSNDPSDIKYHPDFGVFAENPVRTKSIPDPEPWSDDDDEFDQ